MLGGSLTSLVKFTACETFQHFMYKHGWGTHACVLTNTLLLMLYYWSEIRLCQSLHCSRGRATLLPTGGEMYRATCLDLETVSVPLLSQFCLIRATDHSITWCHSIYPLYYHKKSFIASSVDKTTPRPHGSARACAH